MSEQIKTVDRYVVTKDGYLIPLEDGNVVYYGDHIETVQQLQQRNDRLLAALKPFANYACSEYCGCHNCIAKESINAELENTV